jgi:hypothetical protein
MSEQTDLFNPNDSLSLLFKITSIRPEKNIRNLKLLRNPDASLEGNDWAFIVPKCFNDALDIKKTIRIKNKREQGKNKEKHKIWTQGSTFSFKNGDIFYSKKEAYTDWSKAISDELCVIQVISGKSSVPGMKDRKDKSRSISKTGKDRDKGEVIYAIYRGCRNENFLKKEEKHNTTQDGFIKILICGVESVTS